MRAQDFNPVSIGVFDKREPFHLAVVRALHELGSSSNGRCVKIDCAAHDPAAGLPEAGALYLDGGWPAAKTVVDSLLGDMTVEAQVQPGVRDYKTRLQERAAELSWTLSRRLQ